MQILPLQVFFVSSNRGFGREILSAGNLGPSQGKLNSTHALSDTAFLPCDFKLCKEASRTRWWMFSKSKSFPPRPVQRVSTCCAESPFLLSDSQSVVRREEHNSGLGDAGWKPPAISARADCAQNTSRVVISKEKKKIEVVKGGVRCSWAEFLFRRTMQKKPRAPELEKSISTCLWTFGGSFLWLWGVCSFQLARCCVQHDLKHLIPCWCVTQTYV